MAHVTVNCRVCNRRYKDQFGPIVFAEMPHAVRWIAQYSDWALGKVGDIWVFWCPEHTPENVIDFNTENT